MGSDLQNLTTNLTLESIRHMIHNLPAKHVLNSEIKLKIEGNEADQITQKQIDTSAFIVHYDDRQNAIDIPCFVHKIFMYRNYKNIKMMILG